MMKRMITVLLMAAMCSASALAQKGMSGLGLNIPLSTGDGGTALGIGVKYYYNISDYFRLEPSVEYFAIHPSGNSDYDVPLFKGFLNCNFFLLPIRPARPYVIAGVGFVSYEKQVVGGKKALEISPESDNAFCGNIGLGYDFRLNHALSLQLEGTGLVCVEDGSGFHPGKWNFLARVGLTYNF